MSQIRFSFLIQISFHFLLSKTTMGGMTSVDKGKQKTITQIKLFLLAFHYSISLSPLYLLSSSFFSLFTLSLSFLSHSPLCYIFFSHSLKLSSISLSLKYPTQTHTLASRPPNKINLRTPKLHFKDL